MKKCIKCGNPPVKGSPFCESCEGGVIASNIERMLGRIKVASYDATMRAAVTHMDQRRIYVEKREFDKIGLN